MLSLNPLVSVIIPAYNQARYLRQSIDSALAQTYRNFEVIVVDDGSTDDTPLVASQFSNNIRYIRQNNQGLGGARNTGIRAAEGEYIGLLDADDEWRPNYLEKMIALTASHPDATVYYCRAQSMDANGQDLPQTFGSTVILPEKIYETILRANFIIPSTVIMRRSSVCTVGLFDQNNRMIHGCEDWDLWLRILPKHPFVGTEDVLVRYRIHEQSLSTNISQMHLAQRSVVEKHFGIDDGQYDRWSPNKKLAYAGLYRYFLITTIQRQGDWQAGINQLRKVLLIDASKASDVNLFYEIALGTQPAGYRGSSERVDIESNATKIRHMLNGVFSSDKAETLPALKRQTYGTAYYAIGLAAYNTGNLKLSRRYLLLAGRYRPSLWFFSTLPGNFFKSFLGNNLLGRLRKIKMKI